MKTMQVLLLLLFSMGLTAQSSLIDFTDPSTPTYGVDAQKVISFNGENVAMMWCGDANGDGYIRARETIIFTPAPELITSDRDAILNDGLIGEIGGQLQGYYNWDTNLDGYVRAREAIIFTPLPVLIPSDRDVILNTSLEGDVNGQHKVQY